MPKGGKYVRDKGYRIERRAFKDLLKRYWFVMRAGGSRGIFDFVAFDDHWHLVQVKSNRCDKATKERIYNLPVPSGTTKEVWIYKDGIAVPEILYCTKRGDPQWLRLGNLESSCQAKRPT